MDGVDQTSYSAELEAIVQVTRANRDAKRLVWIVDNQSVLYQTLSVGDGSIRLPRFSFGKWLEVAQTSANCDMLGGWVPSHDKHTDTWRPLLPDFGSADQWRQWNSASDVECGRYMRDQQDKRQCSSLRQRIATATTTAAEAMKRLLACAGTYIARDPNLADVWAGRFAAPTPSS